MRELKNDAFRLIVMLLLFIDSGALNDNGIILVQSGAVISFLVYGFLCLLDIIQGLVE